MCLSAAINPCARVAFWLLRRWIASRGAGCGHVVPNASAESTSVVAEGCYRKQQIAASWLESNRFLSFKTRRPFSPRLWHGSVVAGRVCWGEKRGIFQDHPVRQIIKQSGCNWQKYFPLTIHVKGKYCQKHLDFSKSYDHHPIKIFFFCSRGLWHWNKPNWKIKRYW